MSSKGGGGDKLVGNVGDKQLIAILVYDFIHIVDSFFIEDCFRLILQR